MPPIFQYVDDVEKQTMKIWKKGLFSVVTAAKLWLKYLIAIIIRSPPA